MSTTPGRPTVDDVALILRARTKDSQAREVGTFDDDTRPTADDVEKQITAAAELVGIRLPPLDRLAPSILPAVAHVVAYRAALRIEKSYFPEQVLTNRSAYDQLAAEYQADLDALVEAVSEGGGGGEEYVETGFASLPVGSWTLIGRADCPPAVTP